MLVGANTKLAKLVNRDYHILPVLNRFGICTGFGDKTIGQICKEKNINLSLLTELINVYLNSGYVPDIQQVDFSLSELIQYLRRTHDYYRSKLQFIEYLLSSVINNCCKSQKQKIDLIMRFFAEYKTELLRHIQYEDQVLYPYILKLEQSVSEDKPFDLSSKYNLDSYLDEHLHVEEKIVDIKTLILKYLPTTEPSEECNQLIFDLFDFEKDLINHQNIEERILIPMATELERKIIGS